MSGLTRRERRVPNKSPEESSVYTLTHGSVKTPKQLDKHVDIDDGVLTEGDEGAEELKASLSHLVDQMLSANNKQLSGILARFHDTLARREEFRKVMLEDIEWPIESCITVLSSCINRARSHRGGTAVQDALRASRIVLLIICCVGTSDISENVSGSELENLALVCLASLPTSAAVDKSPGNGLLAWYLYIILGELLRNELIDTKLLPENSCDVSSWDQWFNAVSTRIINRKRNQVKSNAATAWKKDEIYHMDGLAHCLASWYMTFDENALFSRTNNIGWSFIEDLSGIIAEDPLDFVNVYVDTIDEFQSRGFIDFVAISYSAWWSVPHRNSGEVEDRIMLAFDLLSGRVKPDGSKSMSKKLSKDFQILAKHLAGLIQHGELPNFPSVTVGKADVHDGITHSGQQTSELKKAIVGQVIQLTSCRHARLWKLCREFCGSHAILALAIRMQELGVIEFMDQGTGKKKYSVNKKYLKQERQYQTTLKRVRREYLTAHSVEDD